MPTKSQSTFHSFVIHTQKMHHTLVQFCSLFYSLLTFLFVCLFYLFGNAMPQNNFPDIKEAARLNQFTLLLIELFTFNCSITFTCTFFSQFASPFIPKIITVLPDFHRGLVSQPLQIPKSANARWKVLVTQSCLTLQESIDCSPPGSSIYGILQARILEWRAIPFSLGFSWPRDQTQVSCIVGGFFFFPQPELILSLHNMA